MAGVGQADMNRASEAAETARMEISNCSAQVSHFSRKVSECNILIEEAQCDIRDTDRKITKKEVSLKRMSKMRGVVADVHVKVRKAVHQLSLLSGVASAAELQTRRMILLEPVMKVMDEMMSALDKIGGDDLLNTWSLQGLMQDMRRNHARLMERAASDY